VSIVDVHKTLRKEIYANRESWYKGRDRMRKNVSVHLGWGKLIFAQTFRDPNKLIEEMLDEKRNQRNLAFYLQEPQIILNLAKGKLFLDPSLAYRLDLFSYNSTPTNSKVQIRFLDQKDIPAVNKIYREARALPIDLSKTIKNQHSKALTYFVAEREGEILGVVTGVDHVELFRSPEGGTSLWGLAVSPETRRRGVGKLLIEYVANHYKTRGRSYLDLSVMHVNKSARRLYKKIGFKKIPRFCIKNKNEINSALYF
jgi:ribosomal protein S18 acetylase RimI-like enzyme